MFKQPPSELKSDITTLKSNMVQTLQTLTAATNQLDLIGKIVHRFDMQMRAVEVRLTQLEKTNTACPDTPRPPARRPW
jgi:hypothetical protein